MSYSLSDNVSIEFIEDNFNTLSKQQVFALFFLMNKKDRCTKWYFINELLSVNISTFLQQCSGEYGTSEQIKYINKKFHFFFYDNHLYWMHNCILRDLGL